MLDTNPARKRRIATRRHVLTKGVKSARVFDIRKIEIDKQTKSNNCNVPRLKSCDSGKTDDEVESAVFASAATANSTAVTAIRQQPTNDYHKGNNEKDQQYQHDETGEQDNDRAHNDCDDQLFETNC